MRLQTGINIGASVCAFVIGALIRFFTTPYVVEHLGAEAYGFVGLTANLLGLTSLLTIALNSMGGRFIAVEYQAGNVKGAKAYYSSLFIANAAVGVLLAAICAAVCVNIDSLVNVPSGLIPDVRLLFAILSANTLLSLVSCTWWVGAFIRNRLEVTRGIAALGSMLQAVVLLALFGLGAAHIWYVGASVFAMGVFVSALNFASMRRLTPEIRLERGCFEWGRIATLLKSGVWNLVSKLSETLSQGLDLLLANMFIGAALTGTLAISRNVPFVLLGLFSSVASAFAPMLVRRYAEGSHSQFMAQVGKATFVTGPMAAAPLACIVAFGADFYSLWIPGEDASLLKWLTVLGMANMVFAMPLEVLWQVFTTTNRLKWPTLFQLGFGLAVFATMAAGCVALSDPLHRIVVVAGARAGWGIVRSLTFLPLYGAHVSCVPRLTFYGPVARSVAVCAICILVGFGVNRLVPDNSWILLIVKCSLVCIASAVSGLFAWNWRRIRQILPVARGGGRMIHFVHRMDSMNAGDVASCPMRYFKWPLPTMEHDIADLDWRRFGKDDIVVIGGGGLFDCVELWNRNINRLLETCGQVFAWSVGFNRHSDSKVSTKIDFGRFAALTIRDWDHPSGFEWLPCVSCMAIDAKLVGKEGKGECVVSQRDHRVVHEGDRMVSSVSAAELVGFMSRYSKVVTNSYHAAYWAGLIGKRVELKDAGYSSKFDHMREVDLGEARRMNESFYRRVVEAVAK